MSLSTGRPSKKVQDEPNLSDVANTPKKRVRVNFNLDEDMYISLKQRALDSRKTITQLLTEMIDEKITER